MFRMTSLLAIIIALMSLVMSYASIKTPRIVTVDIAGITAQFIKQEAKKNHTEAEKKVAIKNFSHALEQALQKLSAIKSLVLLPKEAVIKGHLDYTAELKTMMREEHPS